MPGMVWSRRGFTGQDQARARQGQACTLGQDHGEGLTDTGMCSRSGPGECLTDPGIGLAGPYEGPLAC